MPAHPGELGGAYAITIIYVPLRFITNCVALYWLVRRQPRAALAGGRVDEAFRAASRPPANVVTQELRW